MVVSQCLEVPGEGSFSTVKQSIGNILNGKETSLLRLQHIPAESYGGGVQ